MAKARLSKVLCPACNGTGVFMKFGDCIWCEGDTRISINTALQWADAIELGTKDRYIDGEITMERMRELNYSVAQVRLFIRDNGGEEWLTSIGP